MRLVVLDSGLRNHTGHHNAFARRVRAEALRRGWSVTICGHHQMDPALREELDAVPRFRASPYDRASNDPVCGDIECFLIQNSVFQKDLVDLGATITGSDTLVIVPTITEVQLLGLGQWLTSLRPADRPRCAVALMFPPDFSAHDSGLGIEPALYRVGFKSFTSAPPERVIFYAETDGIAGTFAGICDKPIHTIPWPAVDGAIEPHRTTRDSAAPTVAYLGHGKRERGFHLLPEIVETVLAGTPHAHFLAQVNPDHDPSASAAAARLRMAAPRAEILDGPLSAVDFSRALDRADIMLLPYDPARYAARGSGLLHEAAVRSTPVIATAGTSLAQYVESGELVGVVADSFSAESIAAATHDAMAILNDLHAQGARMAHARAEARTAASFLDSLQRAFHGTLPEVAAATHARRATG